VNADGAVLEIVYGALPPKMKKVALMPLPAHLVRPRTRESHGRGRDEETGGRAGRHGHHEARALEGLRAEIGDLKQRGLVRRISRNAAARPRLAGLIGD